MAVSRRAGPLPTTPASGGLLTLGHTSGKGFLMESVSRRTILQSAGAAGLLGSIAAAGTLGAAPAAAAGSHQANLRLWEGTTGFGYGTHTGTTSASGDVVIDTPAATVDYDDSHGSSRSYDRSTWMSPRVSAPFGATEIIASWNAATPAGTWVEVAAQATTTSGDTTGWYVMGRWTSGDSASDIGRGSVSGQSDQHAAVDTDTLTARNGHTFAGVRLRVRMYRLASGSATPRLTLVAAMFSATASSSSTSTPGSAAGTVLNVPAYSQQLHTGHYPQWNGGGQAWCSPTCTAMILDYWDLGPSSSQTAWVDISGEDRPQVDHAARYVFDYTYEGAGNWTFNTAYAGARGARAYITRLRSLSEAEAFISAGIPLIVSLSFTAEDLTGAGYGTNGHLMVLRGFDDDGDPVMNDPASHLRSDDDAVRVTYARDELESLWLDTSGGLTYIIAPPGQDLPASQGAHINWR